jgi:hypothetical protein
MKTVDIFIKTYYKDFVWLEYLLRSIKKFASGFRNIVIVSDDDGHLLPDIFKEIINFTLVYVKVPETTRYINHGIGYIWQQCIKLNWYKYTNADSVIIFDSDEMLSCNTTPNSFKTNNKYNWFYRKWKDAGGAIVHKESTDKFIGYDTEYESMCITGFYFTLDASQKLNTYLNKIYGSSDIFYIINKHDLSGLSEFNIYGNFIHKIQHPDYNYLYDTKNAFNHSIVKSWSWGGLKDDDKTKRESILN